MHKIAIIGAGISGVLLAGKLIALGHDVHIYEKREKFPDEGGLQLWPNATKILQKSGLYQQLEEEGDIIGGLHFHCIKGDPFLTLRMQEYSEEGIAIDRGKLLNILASKIEGKVIHFGKELNFITEDNNKVQCYFTDGDQLEVDLVIGADGFASKAREYVYGSGDSDNYGGFHFWSGKAEYESQNIIPGELYEYWGPGLRCGYYSIGNGQVNWYASRKAKKFAEFSKESYVLPYLGWTGELLSLVEKTESIAKRNMSDRKCYNFWHKGNVVLMGDAAHPMFTNAGQGACMAIEDAVKFAQAMKENNAVKDAIVQYEAVRIPRAKKAVSVSRKLARLAHLPVPLYQFRLWMFKKFGARIYRGIEKRFYRGR